MKQVNLSLPDDEVAALDAAAKLRGTSRSATIRDGLREWLSVQSGTDSAILRQTLHASYQTAAVVHAIAKTLNLDVSAEKQAARAAADSVINPVEED